MKKYRIVIVENNGAAPVADFAVDAALIIMDDDRSHHLGVVNMVDLLKRHIGNNVIPMPNISPESMGWKAGSTDGDTIDGPPEDKPKPKRTRRSTRDCSHIKNNILRMDKNDH